jgi:hypothetical protein
MDAAVRDMNKNAPSLLPDECGGQPKMIAGGRGCYPISIG